MVPSLETADTHENNDVRMILVPSPVVGTGCEIHLVSATQTLGSDLPGEGGKDQQIFIQPLLCARPWCLA